jgi:hypothetical protein
MSKGKAKVKFIGGVLGGETDEQFDTRSLFDSLQRFNGIWCEEISGKVSILKGEIVGKHWINFSVDKYDKQPKSEDGYFTYIHTGTSVIHRCKAMTKKGLRCQYFTREGFELCTTHLPKK